MKAALIGKEINIWDIELPALDKKKARIKVLYSGLCWSDMHKINMQYDQGLQLIWHEFTWRVIEILDKNSHIKIWDNVAWNPLLFCRKCDNCISGNDNLCREFQAIWRTHMWSFAEYIDVPIENLHVINDMSPKLWALADVVAVALHAIEEFTDVTSEKKILVIWDWAIWAMISHVLRLKWVKKIDISWKYEQNVSYLNNIMWGINYLQGENQWYYDYIFETVGWNQNDTVESSVRQIWRRGKVIFLWVFPEQNQIWFNNRDLFLKEASVNASVAYKSEYFLKALRLLKQNQSLSQHITHELPFDDFKTWIDIMNNKIDYSPVIKVIYRFNYEWI